MNNTAWKRARARAELPHVRVHDLKHTFSASSSRSGGGIEDRQDLSGHRLGGITTHYSSAELSNLREAAELVCGGRTAKVPHSSCSRPAEAA